jgi:PAS domain S-box-containing protein
MKDEEKTREQLIDEIRALRHRVNIRAKGGDASPDSGSRIARALLGNALPMGFSTLREGRFIEVSNSFLEKMGITREEALGKTAVGLGLITDAQRALVSRELQEKGYVENLEMEVRTRRGERMHGLLNATVIRLAGEDYLLSMMTDITRYKEAEEVLRQNEERYRTIIENIGDGYNEVDPRGTFTFFNESFRKLLGYDREELMGMSYLRCTDRQNAEKIFQAYNRVWETGWPLERIEWDVIRKDGERRIIEVSVSLIRDPGGRATGFGSIARDVTERKRAEKTLLESEANYRGIFENAIMGIYQSTPEGRFIKANQAFARIFGYESAENIIQSVTNIGEQIYAKPNDRARVMSMLDQTRHATVETMIRRRDGSRGWVLNNVRIVPNEEGGVRYYEGIVQDITDLMCTEEELKVTQERMQLALRGADLGMYDWNLATKEFIVDDQYLGMLGYTKEDFPCITADTWETMVHPEDREYCLEGYRLVMAGLLLSGSREYRLRHKSGKWIWILDRAKVVEQDDEGRPLRIAGTHFDITERKMLEEKLQKSLHDLELRVLERTAELEEANTTLRVLVKRRAEEQRQLEERLQLNVNDLVLPILHELRAEYLDQRGTGYLDLIESNLKDITSPFLKSLQSTYRNLTRKEVAVASMIREGKKTEEIAKVMGISRVTVESHRNHIREKLGLVKGKTNLRTYLLSIK